MAVDIQFTYPQQVITITSVTSVQDSDPPAVEIVGDDFSAVDEVLLNDFPSPSVVVHSKTKLTAVMPEETRNSAVINVVVVSYRLVYNARSIVAFRMGKTNRKVRGISRLMQLFLKVLLTTPGSDIFSPTVGGGAMRNLGKTFSKNSTSNLIGDFVIAVDNTTKQITSIQSRKLRLPPDERLLSAKVTSARFDASETALVVSVLLISQAGTAATANITL